LSIDFRLVHQSELPRLIPYSYQTALYTTTAAAAAADDDDDDDNDILKKDHNNK